MFIVDYSLLTSVNWFSLLNLIISLSQQTRTLDSSWCAQTWLYISWTELVGNLQSSREAHHLHGLLTQHSHLIWLSSTAWWLSHPSEKYEFVNGKDYIPYMKWKIKFMFQTTNQSMYLCRVFHLISPPLSPILDGQILHFRRTAGASVLSVWPSQVCTNWLEPTRARPRLPLMASKHQ